MAPGDDADSDVAPTLGKCRGRGNVWMYDMVC